MLSVKQKVQPPPAQISFCALLWVVLLSGCATGHDPAKPSLAPIDTLVLLSAPAAVDVDPAPGPDGIAVRIFGTSQAKSKALPIESGTLEIVMFDGVITERTPATAKPLHVWSHTASDLKSLAAKTAIGFSYPLTLLWGQDRPQQDMITIVARYIPPDGRAIYSSPSTIPVGAQRP